MTDTSSALIADTLADGEDPVRHVELPGGGRRPGRTCCERRQAGHPGAVPRDVPSLPADARLPRRDRGEVESEPDQPEGAGAVHRPLADEHGRLLRAAQGGTALRRARGVRHLVHGTAARAVAVARQPSARRAVHAQERQAAAQGQPARGMDDEGRVAVREGARHPADAALRAWLFEHRLRAVHLAAARSVESAVGPLAGPEARVRDSHPAPIK